MQLKTNTAPENGPPKGIQLDLPAAPQKKIKIDEKESACFSNRHLDQDRESLS